MSHFEQRVYLEHIRDALAKISTYTSDGRETFLTSTIHQDAVLRNLEVVGEAVKQLSDEVRARAPSVPWRRIAGMRDVLIHQYFGVDLGAVWGVVEGEVPALRTAVERLLAEEG